MGASNVSSLSSSRTRRATYQQSSTSSRTQFNDTNYSVRPKDDDLGVEAFSEGQSSQLSRFVTGLAHWLKATISRFTSTLSDEEASSITKELLDKCPDVGDALVLNFNGGSHIGVLVRTQAGYAYLSHEKSKSKFEEIKSGARKKHENGTSIEVAALKLRNNIVKSKDRNILAKNSIKLNKLQTGRMIKTFNESKSNKAFSIRGNNCSHLAMKVIKSGDDRHAKLDNLTVKNSMLFPQNAMSFAKKCKNMQSLSTSSLKQPQLDPHSEMPPQWHAKESTSLQPTHSQAHLKNYFKQRSTIVSNQVR
ncbi:MAG: hypothetical protein HAW66_02625 [Shewanella sp.]|nr:hypothetical protein [Shewanella sp.]